ncbi:hypothetical protein S40293_08343 [Stachybotrys chartarum IBT 40293]|nr:hypothetical protein S40293_08343 [Stachybotrys chartarum IBT 40293]
MASTTTANEPLEPAAQPEQPEPIDTQIESDVRAEEDNDSAFETQSNNSSTASLSESILEYRRIHGRTYQSTKTTDYWAPNDEQQNEGLDMIHHALLMILDDKLFLAPIDDNLQRALDVGTGTGIWAMDFADQYPSAEVIGTDISPIQPAWVPPNLRFVIDDCVLEWTWPENHFDFIHLRALYGVIPDLSDLHKKAFRHTKSGGWVQHLEMDVYIESDHVTFPPDHIFNKWADMVFECGRRAGRPFDFAHGHTLKDSLEIAGFVDVSEYKFKAPLHSWPRDPKLKDAGALLQVAFDQSLEGFGTFMFTQILGLDPQEVTVLTAAMRKESRKRSNCPWFRGTVVWGRKP